MVNSKIIWEGNSNIEDFKIVTCKSCLRLFSCEETLKDYWQEVLEEAKNAGTEIWDGQYYRLENIDEIQRGSLQLKLSTIPYSTIRSLIKLGQQQNLASCYFPYHINTGALISTSDDLFVFGQKSTQSGAHFIDLIGGGLQKDELVVQQAIDIKKNILKEAFEEANITSSMIDWINLNSFILTNTMSVVILFNIKLNVDKSQLIQSFEGRVENELSGLQFFDHESVNELSHKENRLSYLSLIPKLVKNFS
ncbi:hypothetical protein [Pseudoalteromonas gelatinilytica]|uniref:Nudix hydrolase domain-containing protein n=1 Tax=Pseudoalteromonas gelatinilytica TaxID=1703256 RepID=A0ABQ1TBY4_9GAMM|nr:hypothetical protein [Pseudoalteromonas profundi]GGE87385.1 hypothetical protein GCM10008027_10300 [Pseudoalteromonas profundi]